MSDSDDDKPISSLIRKLLPTRKPNSQRQTEPEEKPAKKVKVEGGASKSKSEKAEARAANGDSSKRTTTSSSGGGTGSAKRSMAFYEETDKGMLVQRLLVRWWYAIEWPRPEEIGQPPVGYEALEGFPGVFISTKVSFASQQLPCGDLSFFSSPSSSPSYAVLEESSKMLTRLLLWLWKPACVERLFGHDHGSSEQSHLPQPGQSLLLAVREAEGDARAGIYGANATARRGGRRRLQTPSPLAIRVEGGEKSGRRQGRSRSQEISFRREIDSSYNCVHYKHTALHFSRFPTIHARDEHASSPEE